MNLMAVYALRILRWCFVSLSILVGECSNKECPFLHIDPESKIKDCPWYDRGFCKHGSSRSVMDRNIPAVMTLTDKHTLLFLFWIIFHCPVSGPDCRHRHTRRVICVNYLVGFCPEGKSCKFMQYVTLLIWFLHNGNVFFYRIWSYLWLVLELDFVTRGTSLSALFMGWIMSCSRTFLSWMIWTAVKQNSLKTSLFSDVDLKLKHTFHSPRFELPMGASEQPPLPQQTQNQTKVRGYRTITQIHTPVCINQLCR